MKFDSVPMTPSTVWIATNTPSSGIVLTIILSSTIHQSNTLHSTSSKRRYALLSTYDGRNHSSSHPLDLLRLLCRSFSPSLTPLNFSLTHLQPRHERFKKTSWLSQTSRCTYAIRRSRTGRACISREEFKRWRKGSRGRTRSLPGVYSLPYLVWFFSSSHPLTSLVILLSSQRTRRGRRIS